MNWAKRLSTVFAACLLLVAAATPLASAEDDVVDVGYDFIKNTATHYTLQGDVLTYLFYLNNTGGAELTDVEVMDGACDKAPLLRQGDGDGDGVLDPGEFWVFICGSTTPSGAEPLVNTASATASYGDMEIVKKAELTMYPATIRKAVVRYWDYVHKINYPPGADVMFPVHLYHSDEYVGTEAVSKNEPLRLWLRAGEWAYSEGDMPDGFLPARDADEFIAGPDRPAYDNTLFNYILFDLSIEKSGPAMTPAGDPVTYTYRVENAGPGAVAPLLGDNMCDPITYVSGDTDADDLVDPGEVWMFECTMVPTWTFNEPFTNYVTVRDADYPTDWVPRFGRDTILDNNTDSFTLYPFVLRKDMFLYWDSPANTIPIDGFEDVEFEVAASRNGDHVGYLHISEDDEAKVFLSEGKWKFAEKDLPEGFVSGYDDITYITGEGYPDWTFPNVALFDLSVEKAGPAWAKKGETILYTYEVSNAGPAPVTPMITDDKCDPIAYVGGDTDGDGLVDPGEVWEFECAIVPTWTFNEPFINTVTVWDEEGEGLEGWYLGGDTNLDNNTDSFTLYPFVLRKDMFLYWDSPANTIPIDGFEDVEFEVAASRNGDHVGYLHISEDDEAKVFLSEGKWKFAEKDLPEGFVSGYDDITYITGEGYPDWTFPNVALFDLSVQKKLWWGEVLPGKTIAYKYKVRNAGPAPVAPVIEDDLCAPLKYKWGDKDGDGLVDPGETWVFKCKYKVVEPPFSKLTNTVKVWDEEGEGLEGWYLGGDTNLDNNTDSLTLKVSGWYGCQPWCWRHADHLDDWPDGYTPDTPVAEVFRLWKKLDLDRDGHPDTLEDALHYKGGTWLRGLKRKLLKAAVTALLNEAEYGDLFPAYASEAELIDKVHRVYRSGRPWKIKKLTTTLQHWNSGYCAL